MSVTRPVPSDHNVCLDLFARPSRSFVFDCHLTFLNSVLFCLYIMTRRSDSCALDETGCAGARIQCSTSKTIECGPSVILTFRGRGAFRRSRRSPSSRENTGLTIRRNVGRAGCQCPERSDPMPAKYLQGALEAVRVGQMSRREFIKRRPRIGVSAGAAYGMLRTGRVYAQETPTPEPTTDTNRH